MCSCLPHPRRWLRSDRDRGHSHRCLSHSEILQHSRAAEMNGKHQINSAHYSAVLNGRHQINGGYYCAIPNGRDQISDGYYCAVLNGRDQIKSMVVITVHY